MLSKARPWPWLLDELSGSPGGLLAALLTRRTETQQALCAIGAGWASARLGKPCHWLPQELDPKYNSVVADGYGFHQGFFNSQRFTGRGFPGGTGELSAPYDIGLGRALWFIHLGRVEPIAHDIGAMPLDRQMQLWRGIGTACAFTGNKEHASTLLNASVEFETYIRAGLNTGTQLLYALDKQARKDIFIMKEHYKQDSL